MQRVRISVLYLMKQILKAMPESPCCKETIQKLAAIMFANLLSPIILLEKYV